MLRAVVLGLLAVYALSACSKASDKNSVAQSDADGRVVEVSGKVAASRGGASRALAVGDAVYRDDVIETGADGSLVIELAHNNARWAVEGNQKTRVDDSVAWGLAKQDKPAKVVDHATSAAGRDGERTAAETRATTATEAAPAVQAPPAAQPAPAAAAEAPADRARASAAPDRLDRGPREKKADADGAAEPPPPPPPPPPEPAKAASLDQEARGGGGASNSTSRGLGAAPAPAVDDPLRALVETKRAELFECVGGKPAQLTVRLASGKPTAVLRGKVTKAMSDCVHRVLKALAFPSTDGKVTLELK